MSDLPIGTVCAFAGQANPITGAMNDVWASSACGASDPQDGEEDPNGPVTNLEAQGWMLCDGRVLGISDYPELYAVLGSLYGEGTAANGVAGFVIPDYRGLFLRGNDAGAGIDPDTGGRLNPTGLGKANVVGSLQCDALQDHAHDYNALATSTVSDSGQAAALTTTNVATTSPNAPALVSSETRAKNIAVNYVIKFR
jgi:microcystin-dependent protein